MMLQIDLEVHSVIMSIFCKTVLHPEKIASKFMLFLILIAQGSLQHRDQHSTFYHAGYIQTTLPSVVCWFYLSLHTTYREIISRT